MLAQRAACAPERGSRTMLFFFELFLFVLVMLTLALGEFVSRWLALILWLVVTVFALGGYVLARQSLAGVLAGDATGGAASELNRPDDLPSDRPEHGSSESDHGEPARPEKGTPGVGGPTAIEEKWARTLLYNWRRTNVLLILGAVAVGGWYWLAG